MYWNRRICRKSVWSHGNDMRPQYLSIMLYQASSNQNAFFISNNVHYFHVSVYHQPRRHTKTILLSLWEKNRARKKSAPIDLCDFMPMLSFIEPTKKYAAENRSIFYCTHTFFTWLHEFSRELSAVFFFFTVVKICFFAVFSLSQCHSNIINNMVFCIARNPYRYIVLQFRLLLMKPLWSW